MQATISEADASRTKWAAQSDSPTISDRAYVADTTDIDIAVIETHFAGIETQLSADDEALSQNDNHTAEDPDTDTRRSELRIALFEGKLPVTTCGRAYGRPITPKVGLRPQPKGCEHWAPARLSAY